MSVVTYYAWIEGDPANGGRPASLKVNCGGGQRIKDATTGNIITTGYVEAQFNNGILHVDPEAQPDVYAQLEKLCKPGNGITKDYEEFFRHTAKPEQRTARMERQIEEQNRLIEKLSKGKGAGERA